MTELEILKLGRKGDGIASENGKDIFIPFTIEGERVAVSGTGPRREVTSIVSASPRRINPVCDHFTTCGGCQLQHVEARTYQEWKESITHESLGSLNVQDKFVPLRNIGDAKRRKVVFNIGKVDNQIVLGFSQRASNRIVPIDQCSVSVPEIIDNLDQLRELVVSVPVSKSGTRMAVLSTNSGLDITIEGCSRLSSDQRQVLIRKAIALDIPRLTVDDETLIETKKPIVLIDDIPVIPPPGSFVQAAKQAEMTMIDIVTNHLKSCKNVTDLFCGIGTFALPLARKSTVWAVEENKTALEALNQAWRGTAGKLKQIEIEARNLDRRPVTFAELKKFDGLVFDPPRAGAEMQAKQIAKSKVQKVVAVSCNPVTLARDLEILVAGGFVIEKIFPIDQFKYSPHVEVVVTLQKG